MGRTLHYKIKKIDDSDFTKKEEIAMVNISRFYNSGQYKNVWTCENFWLSPVDYYPNWDNPFIKALQDNAWGHINKLLNELEDKGLNYIDAVRQLEKERIVSFFDKSKKKVRAFTKTQGNEFNSLLVLLALVDISKAIPKAEISLYDEGEFLLCNLKIRNGKVLPDIEDMFDSLKHYFSKMMFSPSFKGNILDKLEYKAKDFEHCLAQDIGFGSSYGDMTMYVNKELRNLKLINDILVGEGLKDNEFFVFNFEKRKHDKWFDPMLFTRPVDLKKFKNYKSSPATLMDGLGGEGFGLTDEDSEAKSYRAIANIQNILTGVGFNKCDLKILQKIG